jgi:hypothetical protein
VQLNEQSNESDSENSISIATMGAFFEVADDGSDVADINDDRVIKLVRNKRNNKIDDNNSNDNILSSSSVIDDGVIKDSNSNDPSRSRRDTTINCGGNVNTKTRQLNIGCSGENKIDVSPQCISSSEDVEEGDFHFLH